MPFNSKKEIYKIFIISVFLIAGALRISLAIVNREANDDHFQVVKIIKNEGRLPTYSECWEGFQPKLYHSVIAVLCKCIPSGHMPICIIMTQLLNCAAGMITIYIVWSFLRNLAAAEWVKLVCLSFVALNPDLIGINAQATNDSFVIMFSTATLYCFYLFFSGRKIKYFFGLIIFSVFAALSKGSGIVLFFGILSVFILKLIVSRNFSLSLKRGYLSCILIFSFVYLTLVPLFGQYYYNYRQCGSPFVVNREVDPFPDFFKETYCYHPGVTSIKNSYLTFRLFDLIKHPTITNDEKIYPLHRTSLWSQLHGRAHFIFFSMWPPTWQTENAIILNMGRVILALALIPALFLLVPVFRRIGAWFNAIIRNRFDFIINSNDWIFDVFFLAYICSLICYTLSYREFNTMKAIYIFPALLSAVFLFSSEIERVYKHKRLVVLLSLFFGLLLVLYILNITCLILKLSHLPIAKIFT